MKSIIFMIYLVVCRISWHGRTIWFRWPVRFWMNRFVIIHFNAFFSIRPGLPGINGLPGLPGLPGTKVRHHQRLKHAQYLSIMLALSRACKENQVLLLWPVQLVTLALRVLLVNEVLLVFLDHVRIHKTIFYFMFIILLCIYLGGLLGLKGLCGDPGMSSTCQYLDWVIFDV